MDGFDPVQPLLVTDAQLAGINGNFDNIICMDSIFPELMIKNKGTTMLTSLRIIYHLDGKKDTIDWAGNLGTNQLTTIAIPTIPVTTGKHYFAAICTNPNNGTDQNLSNNSLSFQFFAVESPKEVEFTLKTDDYGNETSWELRNAAGSLIKNNSNYPRITGGAVYNESLCLYDGCYRFTIFDSYSDGICCSNGAGYYLLKNVVNGDTIKFNSKFMHDKESTEFCVGDSCTILVDARVWPVSDINVADGNIELTMIAGNPPFTFNWTNGKNVKDIGGLAIGTYGVTVTDSLGCTAYFTFDVNLTTGVTTQQDIDEGILIYPNPSQGLISVKLNNLPEEGAEIAVYDLNGRMVHSSRLNNKSAEVDLRGLKRGMYVMQLNVGNRQVYRKIMLN